jgi:hypothetical protein
MKLFRTTASYTSRVVGAFSAIVGKLYTPPPPMVTLANIQINLDIWVSKQDLIAVDHLQNQLEKANVDLMHKDGQLKQAITNLVLQSRELEKANGDLMKKDERLKKAKPKLDFQCKKLNKANNKICSQTKELNKADAFFTTSVQRDVRKWAAETQ